MHSPLARRVIVIALFLAALVALPPLGVTSPVSAAPTPCSDLAISNFTITPSTPIAGQQATISFKVSNNGTCSTNTSFVVQWKQSVSASTGPSTTVNTIAAGGSRNVNLTYTFPNAGNFLTLVSVDTGHAISETNEVNNLAIYSVSVDRAQTDLIITDFNVTTPQPGNSMEVGQALEADASVTVQNNGNTDAGPFQVAWQPTLATPPLTVNVAGGLTIGSSTTVNFVFNYQDIGNFITKATVDSTHLVPETNELNNSDMATVHVLPALPDLVLTGIGFNPPSPIAGQNVHVTISYENRGFVSTGQNFTVSWKPIQLGTTLSTQVGPLAAGASSSVGFDYIYQSGGTFISSFKVDSNDVITELDETNNDDDAEPITIAAANVDLTIDSVTISPATPTQGVNATATVHIVNNGNDAAGPFVVSWNPDGNGILVPSVATLTKQVNSLGAGAGANVVFTFAWPQDGAFHTIANVDAFDVISETNETNNLYIKDLTVSPGDIDLRIRNADISFSPSPSPQYGKVTATVTIKNVGSLPVSWFQVQWKTVATNTTGPSKWIPGLNPGESTTITLDSYYFHAGIFSSTVTVDPMHLITESDETNNTGTKNITITSVP